MKNLLLAAIMVLASLPFNAIDDEIKEVKTQNSKVIWKGYKVTGSHQGTIGIQSGSLTFNEGKLIGGKFTIEMESIACTDLQGEYKGQLEGHLKSDDFFGVNKFPAATLIFTKVKSTGKNSYQIAADLTIKGKTNAITFEASVYGNKANASIKIDRTKYDVRYGSSSFFEGLKDKAIYDEFDLVIDVAF